MKKAVLIILAIIFLAAPALVLYFSMKTSASAMQAENEKQLLHRMQNELQRQDMLINPVVEIYRKLFIALRGARQEIIKLSTKNNISEEILSNTISLLEETTAMWSGGEAALVYRHQDQDKSLTIKNGKTLSAGLSEGGILLLHVLQQHLFTTGETRKETIQQLRNLVQNQLAAYFSLASFRADGDSNRIQRAVMREPGSYRLLMLLRLDSTFLINFLIDLTRVDADAKARRQVANWQHRDMGLAIIDTKQSAKTHSSDFFADNRSLQRTLRELVVSSNEHSMSLRKDGFLIIATGIDPKKHHRSVIAARVPSTVKQPGMIFLVIFFALAGCFISKLLVESVVLGRGGDISVKVFILSIFILVTMLPLLSSAFLANEYIVANFKKEKNRVVKELAEELLHLDLQALANYQASINLARGLNSVEKLAELAELPASSSINELVMKAMQKLYLINDKPICSSIWVYDESQKFFAVTYSRDKRRYEFNHSDNFLLEELFLNKYREYMTRQNPENKSGTVRNQANTIEFDALKSELLDSFFLNMFGDKTYYKLREDFGSLIKQESFMDTNSILTIPITDKGKARYIFTWIFDSASIRDHFPEENLGLNSAAPLFLIYGNDQYVGARPDKISSLGKKFPALVALGNQSLMTGSRLFLQDYIASGSPVFEARPARYSDFIMCGSRYTRDLNSINRELTAETLKYFTYFAGGGIILALLTSLYFTIPLRQLISATKQISAGNYGVRLDPRHPDEFALAASTFNKMATGLQQGVLLSSFVSESVKQLADQEKLTSADIAQNAEVTVLFSSIRDFDSLQQRYEPQKVFEILQAHLSAAVDAVALYGGEIDKMIEDKVMIVFDSKRRTESEHVMAAVEVAIAIKKTMVDQLALKTAVGITTGEVVAGVMGASNVRLSKTVVGDTVNLAARLAAIAATLPDGGIVAAESSMRGLSSAYHGEKLPIKRVKGKTHSIEAWLIKPGKKE